MPYIKQDLRKQRREIKHLGKTPSLETAGELNYEITLLCLAYLDQKSTSYETLNSIIGALESAKLEFYRRVIVPYERNAMDKNGDVY